MDQQASRNPVFEGVELGIGTWSWGDRFFWGYQQGYGDSDIQAAFETALAGGVRFFDSAETYGSGRAESLLGQFMKTTEIPVRVATKFMPYPWRLNPRALLHSLQHSLERLGRTRVDLYQMHWPFPPLKIETWMEAMIEAYQKGQIGAVGVSNYDRAQTERAHEALLREGIPLASNQVEYNLLNRRIEQNGLMQYCRERGITVIAYSPLGMGLLTGKYTPEHPPRGLRARKYGLELLTRAQPLISALKKIGTDHDGKTPAQVALNWIICKGAVPIPGAKTRAQAEQNFGAAGWRLAQDEMVLLDEMSGRLKF